MEQDLGQCVVYLEKAADQGHAKALFNLGLIYERGQGVALDLEKARLCYTEAAALGNIKVRSDDVAGACWVLSLRPEGSSYIILLSV